MEDFNQKTNDSEPENSDELNKIIDSYSPYPLISPVAAAFLGLIGGFILYQFVGGLLSGEEVSLDINYNPTHATHDASTGLIADMVNRTVRNFQLVLPDANSTTWSFSALVTAFEPSEPIDDKLSASVTLKVTGQPTLA